MTAEELKKYRAPTENEVLIVFTSGPNEPMPFSGESTVRDKHRYQLIKSPDKRIKTDELIKSYRRKAAQEYDSPVQGVYTLAEYNAAIGGSKPKADKASNAQAEVTA